MQSLFKKEEDEICSWHCSAEVTSPHVLRTSFPYCGFTTQSHRLPLCSCIYIPSLFSSVSRTIYS